MELSRGTFSDDDGGRMSKRKLATIAAVAVALAVIVLLVPRSEEYSDFGFGVSGKVDVNCANALGGDDHVDFADRSEQQFYDDEVRFGFEPNMFEGKTASEVCADLRKQSVIAAVVLGIVAAVASLMAAARGSQQQPGGMAGTRTSSPVGAPSQSSGTWSALQSSSRQAGHYFLGAGVVLYGIAAFLGDNQLSPYGPGAALKLVVVGGTLAIVVAERQQKLIFTCIAAGVALYLFGGSAPRLSPDFGEESWIRAVLVVADLALAAGLWKLAKNRQLGKPDLAELAETHRRAFLGAASLAAVSLVVALGPEFDTAWAPLLLVVFWLVPLAAAVWLGTTGKRSFILVAGVSFGLHLVSTSDRFYEWLDTNVLWLSLTRMSLLALIGIAGVLLTAAEDDLEPASGAGSSTFGAVDVPPPPRAAEIEVAPTVPPPPPPPVGTDVFAPRGNGSEDSGSADDTTLRKLPGAEPTTAFLLDFDDGHRHVVGPTTLVGRAPTPDDRFPSAAVLRYEDFGMTVSKTHFLVGVDADGLWVQDLDSANGTAVVSMHGEQQVLPGVRARPRQGDRVRFGDRWFDVVE